MTNVISQRLTPRETLNARRLDRRSVLKLVEKRAKAGWIRYYAESVLRSEIFQLNAPG
jgi:hypothetical protein